MEGSSVKQISEDRYVVDASVAVKWYSKADEEDLTKADLLMDEHIEGKCTLFAPSLLLYELSNALRFNPNFTEQDVIRAINDFNGLNIQMIDFGNLLFETISLAYRKELTVYDSVYVTASEVYNIPLVTADRKLYEKVKDLSFVIFLTDLK